MSFIYFHSVSKGQSPCSLVKDYSIAICKKDTAAALGALENFIRIYPNDSIRGEVKLAAAAIFYHLGKYPESEDLAKQVVEDLMQFSYGRMNTCAYGHDENNCSYPALYFVTQNQELQSNACFLLYDNFIAEGKYDSALYYLSRAHNEFSGFHRPLPSNYLSKLNRRYANVYELLGQPDKAISRLLQFIWTDGDNERLIYLIKKYKDVPELKRQLQSPDDSLQLVRDVVVSENPEVVYERGKYGEMLRTTTIEEYGRKVYWHFLGERILLNSVNDYRSTAVKGEKKKRKLKRRVSDEEMLEKAKENLRAVWIWKAIMEIK
jgi:tetratricopeptide (TPR) repeat protein